MVVGNRDKCRRCGARHGGNNHLCPVHGAVSEGCCEPLCDKADWLVLKTTTPGGLSISADKIRKQDANLTGYTPDGEGFGGLPIYTKVQHPGKVI